MAREGEAGVARALDEGDGALSFARFVQLLDEPPFEPCGSELRDLTTAEYDETFSEVQRLYYRKIRGYILYMTKDPSSADDLTQEVFINVYRARMSFARAYIYRAATNTALRYLRRRTRHRRFLRELWADANDRSLGGRFQENEAADPRPLPDAEMIERAREEALQTAVERLPEPFRTPLRLRAAGHSYERIVEITQTAEGTVKSRICRGKSILRRRLRAYL